MNKPTRTQLLLTVSVAAICALASSARSQQIKADGTVVFVPADVVIDTGTTAAAAGSVLWALNSGYINADAGVELTTGGINAHAVLAMLNSTILVSAGTVTTRGNAYGVYATSGASITASKLDFNTGGSSNC
ncbi:MULTISPECIES: hypothetical protein [Brucella]|jgi:hypothetical protein|uniref:hypothetical protein n=1 Tax=Brucella TaxID=234 RepID=UPI00124C0557|nr:MULTISPECIES: hypothetical protein [Brucella]KAB2786777.1 hypothetical protein F9K96_21235 [Brucella anthropi]QOD66420.1 hypothetical protein HGK82_15975 [Ochrobactrum sp. MT180101]UZD71767.1 hypothetical protein LJ361_10600 [Brucella sp. JSBI001]